MRSRGARWRLAWPARQNLVRRTVRPLRALVHGRLAAAGLRDLPADKFLLAVHDGTTGEPITDVVSGRCQQANDREDAANNRLAWLMVMWALRCRGVLPGADERADAFGIEGTPTGRSGVLPSSCPAARAADTRRPATLPPGG